MTCVAAVNYFDSILGNSLAIDADDIQVPVTNFLPA